MTNSSLPNTDAIAAAVTRDGSLSIVAGITTHLVREIQRRHESSPTVIATLGRLATGAVLLGAGLKGEERLSLHLNGNGPAGLLVAEVARVEEHVLGARAYSRFPKADMPRNDLGQIDIRQAIGEGSLQVAKSYENNRPFIGIVPIDTGDVAGDIAGYLVNSQQIPSITLLGTTVDDDGVRSAGGIVAQVMPGNDESVFLALQERAARMPLVTTLIREGASPTDLLAAISDHVPLRGKEEFDVRFSCRCTREKVETAMLGFGHEELQQIAREEPVTEAICEFCRQVYTLSADEVAALAHRLTTSD